MTLEQVKANQVTMRIDINTIQEKMDQLLETMLTIAQRERIEEEEARAKRNDSMPGLNPQDEGYVPTKKRLVQMPVGGKGDGDHAEPSDTSTHHGSEIGDDQYDAFYMPDQPKPKILPDLAADRLCALEKNIKAI